jgi:hypothetical protein
MTTRLAFAAGCCLATVIAIAPGRVEACSRQLVPALVGSPADGDVGVPTDVVPVYDRTAAGLEGDPTARFELAGDNGEVIALTRRNKHVWGFELVPASALAPNTRYTLRGSWQSPFVSTGPVELALSFTTGSGPTVAPPDPPVAAIQHYDFRGLGNSSCDPQPTGSCLSLPQNTMVQAIVIDDFGQENGRFDEATGAYVIDGYLFRGSFMFNLSGLDQGTNFVCVKLQARGANGSLSQPTVVCGGDGPIYRVDTPNIDCTAQGLTTNGIPVSNRSGGAAPAAAGCSVARQGESEGEGQGQDPATAGLLAAALAALLLAVRTRRA